MAAITPMDVQLKPVFATGPFFSGPKNEIKPTGSSGLRFWVLRQNGGERGRGGPVLLVCARVRV